jgi:hypothetical protein
MHRRLLMIISLSCLLPFPRPVEASTEARSMQDGTPVQVHAIEQALDRNHEENQPQPQRSASWNGQTGGSKIQADGPGFRLPLRRGLSNNNPGVFGISNFVDHDDVMPDGLMDWNCGVRTYDTDNFDHNGTDYNSSQFPWLTMANDGLVVVAAADGEIVDRHDGEPDKQCSFDDNADSNLVVLKHEDGSITIYAHMKTGTVTPRKVGDRVEQGDYLGVVGSSGLSTGPHLHLGVQDIFNNLFDPYAGNCNALYNESFWAEQESYHEKGIMSVDTHSAAPEYPPCPQQEVPHFNNVFGPEDDIFVSVTARDFEGTDEIVLELRNPSGGIDFSTTFSDDTFDYGPAVSIVFELQANGPSPQGKYRLSATFGGQTGVHDFYVGDGPDPAPETNGENEA